MKQTAKGMYYACAASSAWLERREVVTECCRCMAYKGMCGDVDRRRLRM